MFTPRTKGTYKNTEKKKRRQESERATHYFSGRGESSSPDKYIITGAFHHPWFPLGQYEECTKSWCLGGHEEKEKCKHTDILVIHVGDSLCFSYSFSDSSLNCSLACSAWYYSEWETKDKDVESFGVPPLAHQNVQQNTSNVQMNS